uniref:DUF4408 domain-containing protein n=1 Tax=Brassica oleracea var. oleracea TaxID=109376 RepID=A0A0D3AWD8_BRAOL
MEMKRDLRVEEENMCTSLLTAFVVLSMACLKHFYSVSYLIEQWRSLVFLLLNVVLLAVYFTSTRPVSGKTHHNFKTRRGGALRMMRERKSKKAKKTRVVEEPACSVVVEPKEVIKNCIVEETRSVCPEFEDTVKDCLLHKDSVDSHDKEDESEPGRLSNEELNERVEAFITTFRQHLVLDARRGRDRKTNQKMRTKDSDISILGPVRFVNWTRHPDADADRCSFGAKQEVKLDAASRLILKTHPDFFGFLDEMFERFQLQQATISRRMIQNFRNRERTTPASNYCTRMPRLEFSSSLRNEQGHSERDETRRVASPTRCLLCPNWKLLFSFPSVRDGINSKYGPNVWSPSPKD